MLVVLTLALVVASGACLAMVGLALAVWPPALLAAAAEGALAARAVQLTLMLAAPLAVFWLVRASWSAFARARAGRCADFMLAALVGALGLHAFFFGL